MFEAMNAPSPVPPPAGGGDQRPYEPSMEEILASIRRIIADDQSLPRPQPSEEPAPAEEPAGSVHQLRAEAGPAVPHPPVAAEPIAGEDRTMVSQGIVAAPQFAGREGPVAAHGGEWHEPALSGRLEAIHQQHTEPAIDAYDDDTAIDFSDSPEEHDRPTAVAASAPLSSAATNSTVSAAFNVLAASRLADNSDELLGMTREMIRPLLRAWLDENLPSMVERMVRDEIERVARGGH